ncbi:MAG: glycosyltransferase family 4 protein [Aquabacterium sp.]|nr:glycosyltransferase family 4 protein [Aquabacterium sp.]
MKVALLCSGLGHVLRGHETFARQLVQMLADRIDLTLFKGGGESSPGELVIPNIPRDSPLLARVHPKANPKWAASVADQERHRIESETFAYAALAPLMAGGYDVVHCLEREVCTVLHRERHLFARPPRLLFSNGGAIPDHELPPCDAVQEHTPYNARFSARNKAVVIPHGVDLTLFRPDAAPLPRERLGIAPGRRVAISVGTICRHHKRMDHVIEAFAALPEWHLMIVGQESPEADEIRALGRARLGDRVSFHRALHPDLPQYYAAAEAFVLGSMFETFGIVYLEAMAMALPVFCTTHPNQRSIVADGGIYVDMRVPAALVAAIRQHSPESLAATGRRGRQVVERGFDQSTLYERYVELYSRLAHMPPQVPQWTASDQWRARLRNLKRRLNDRVRGRAESN